MFKSLRTLLFSCGLLAASLNSADAQLKGRLAEKPLAVGYMRNMSQKRMMEYMYNLGNRLEVGKTTFGQIPIDTLDAAVPDVPEPIAGVAWYMVQGLLPTYDVIYFQEVRDEDDARSVLRGRAKMYGQNGELKPQGDNFYLLEQGSTSVMPIPKGQDAEEYAKQFRRDSGSFKTTAEVFTDDEDGKQKIKYRWYRPEYYRFREGLLFSSSFEELKDVQLPTRDSLTSRVSTDNDIGAEASFDRIPLAIKQLGWNMLNSTAGTQMQARDEEEPVDAELRRSSVSTGLDIVKSVMFDVETLDTWVRFATDEVQDVRAQVDFNTRRGSGLGGQLQEVSSSSSKMAQILADEAAVTLHVNFRYSKSAAEMVTAFAAWMQLQLASETNSDPLVMDAASQIADTLGELAERRDIELLVKLGHTEATDGVIYGGLQVGDNPSLLGALYRMTIYEELPQEVHDSISLFEDNGLQMIRLSLPEDAMTELHETTSLAVSDIYLAHRNSVLWFAAGGSEAVEIIHSNIARCEAAGLATRTPLLTFDVDADKWLAYPQDDPVGVGGLLRWMDENVGAFPPTLVMGFMGGSGSKPTPLIDPVFELGGNRTMKWTIVADEGGARLKVNMGEAIANYHVARMIDSQDRMMRNVQRRQEEVQAKNEEAKASKQPTPARSIDD